MSSAGGGIFRVPPPRFAGGFNFGLSTPRFPKIKRSSMFGTRQAKGPDYVIDLTSFTLGLKGGRGKKFYKSTALFRPGVRM